MTRYTQDQNFRIIGPGLPESGAVAVGVDELEAAYNAGLAWAEGVARKDAESGRKDFARTGMAIYRQMMGTALFIADMCRDERHASQTKTG